MEGIAKMENQPQLEFITPELLGLENIEVLSVKLNSDGEFIIEVKSTEAEVPCHKCGKPCKKHGYGQTLTLRHLPILGRKSFIEIKPPRGICDSCDNNPTTTQLLPWYHRNGRRTTIFEQSVLFALINSTISDVSIKEDIGEHAIQNIIDRYIDSKPNWKKIKKIGILGIDEISLKKGYQDYVTIITSRVNGKIIILAVLKGRNKPDIKAFFSSIPHKKRKSIIAVCSDMYDGFVNAAKEVFGKELPIVVDRFHVAKLYRKCLVDLRVKELARLRRILSESDYKELKSAIAILKNNKEFITKKEKKELSKIFQHAPILKIAYRYCRKLTVIFNTKHKKETANKKIIEWISDVESSELKCFDTFIGTLKKYQDYITNYFLNRHNSGFVEGFNNKVKVIKRRCYGIFDINHLFQRIFLDSSGYDNYNLNQCVSG
tara:strand:- start:31 stop:1326 length:1296 start_codon:yes stop_codon:yes gene_type:complete